MTIPTPPVGARVRHTTTYPDGTTTVVESAVTGAFRRDGGFFVGYGEYALFCSVSDKPGEYTVALEVLDSPAGPVLPPEPPNGTVYVSGLQVWMRDDAALDDQGLWWGTHHVDHEPWEVVAPIVAQPGWRRYIPDPADTAPALPWEVEDNDDDSLEIQVADAEGIAVMVSVNNESVYLAPATAREAAGVLLRAVREFEERQR